RAVALESDIEWALAKYYGIVRPGAPAPAPTLESFPRESTRPYGGPEGVQQSPAPAPTPPQAYVPATPPPAPPEEPILLDRPKKKSKSQLPATQAGRPIATPIKPEKRTSTKPRG